LLEKLPRSLKWLLAAIGGALISAVTTPLAQASIDVLGVTIPWGLVAALITVTAYVLGLRLVSDTRMSSLFGAIGVVVVIMLLSLPGPGGGVIVPGNLYGTLWAAVPSLIFVVIIAFPSPRRR
jgi:energy-converting hydrogenase Eha subunit B